MPLISKPHSSIILEIGLEKNGRIQKFMTNACYKRMDKYVPYSGTTKRYHLRENVTLTSNSITYEMPYATYQYYGARADGSHKIQRHTTPGTGTYWDKKMLSAEKDALIKEIKTEALK